MDRNESLRSGEPPMGYTAKSIAVSDVRGPWMVEKEYA